MHTDREIVGRALNGEVDASSLIIKMTERLVATIVFKMIAYAEDRKDITQDIYVKALDKLTGFRFQSRLSTWIAQIAYNTCHDYLRKTKRLLSEDWVTTDEVIDESDYTRDKELLSILHTAIEILPPVYRTMIILFHREDQTYEDISLITSMPVGTVKSYLFRARQALKNNLLANYKKEDL